MGGGGGGGGCSEAHHLWHCSCISLEASLKATPRTIAAAHSTLTPASPGDRPSRLDLVSDAAPRRRLRSALWLRLGPGHLQARELRLRLQDGRAEGRVRPRPSCSHSPRPSTPSSAQAHTDRQTHEHKIARPTQLDPVCHRAVSSIVWSDETARLCHRLASSVSFSRLLSSSPERVCALRALLLPLCTTYTPGVCCRVFVAGP